MNYKIFITYCLFIAGINQFCIGQNTESASRVFPVNIESSFPSSGYMFSKTVANTKISGLKDAREKQLLPIDGKIEFLTSLKSTLMYDYIFPLDSYIPKEGIMNRPDFLKIFKHFIFDLDNNTLPLLKDAVEYFKNNSIPSIIFVTYNLKPVFLL